MSSKKESEKETKNKAKNEASGEKVNGAMDEANAKVLEVWEEKGEEAAVAHMSSGRTYAEMRSMYG